MGILRQRMRTTNARLSHKKSFSYVHNSPTKFIALNLCFYILRIALTEECNM